MALLTNAAIQGYCDYTKRRIAYAKYKVGSTYYKVPIESVWFSSAGVVEIAFKIELSSGSVRCQKCSCMIQTISYGFPKQNG